MVVGDERKGPVKVLIAMSSGTYGRFDEVSGGLILASSLATDGMEVTILLRGDGVFVPFPGQDPNEIGIEDNLQHLEAAVELGVRVVALSSSLEARGLSKEDIEEYVEVIDDDGLGPLVAEHGHWIQF